MEPTQVLIVEDDQALKKMLSSVLGLRGYQVFVAEDQPSALSQLNAHPAIQCIIQDLGLPPFPASTEAGLQTMRSILMLNPNAKIIVLTGKGKQEAAIQAVREGAFDFFEKPISVDVLVSAIERSLLFWGAEKNLRDHGTYPIHFNSPLEEDGLKGSKDVFEAELVRRVLNEVDFNIRLASDRLGLRRENLYYLIRKHGIHLTREEGAFET